MKTDEIIELAEKQGVVRGDDAVALGASPSLLAYMADNGLMRRVVRGVYTLPDMVAEYGVFWELALAVPHGVICLLSALQFHEITTQLPTEVWVAIERGKHMPRSSEIPLHFVKLSGAGFATGIQEIPSDGATIRVYSPAKTVIDCFRFRNRVGIDVAREALADSLAQGKATREEIWRLAQQCRIARVIRPYLEMAHE